MEINLNLRERTVLITGPFSTTIQSLVMNLTQLGADCILMDKTTSTSSRFCSQVTDQRETNSKFGRATAIEVDYTSKSALTDAISKAAQIFGSIDIYIDAHLYNDRSAFENVDSLEKISEFFDFNLKSSLITTSLVVPFLKSRKRGRILYLLNENRYSWSQKDLVVGSIRSALRSFAEGLSGQLAEYNVTVNTLSLGLTEEYILGHFPESGSIKEMVKQLQEKEPNLKITEPDRVSQTVLFLISNMGLSISGQNLKLT